MTENEDPCNQCAERLMGVGGEPCLGCSYKNREYVETSKNKFLLNIGYTCASPSWAPGNRWFLYEGKEMPAIGAMGFGSINCYNYVSVQSCESENCNLEDRVEKIEPYTPERAKELGLE